MAHIENVVLCEIREGHCSDNGVLFIACIIKSAKVLTVKMFGVVSYCRVQEKGFLETTCTFVYMYSKNDWLSYFSSKLL